MTLIMNYFMFLPVFWCLVLACFHSSRISQLCVESLSSVVGMMSQMGSDGKVDANPAAAAASAPSSSGINPVSRDSY